eukprot:3693450-Amphidinium_carterae.1
MAERFLAFKHLQSALTRLKTTCVGTKSAFPTEFSMVRSDSVTSLASTAKLEAEPVAEGSRASEWQSVKMAATGTMEFSSVPGTGASIDNPNPSAGVNPDSSNPSAAADVNQTVRTLHTAEMYPYGPPASVNPFDDLGDVSDDDD